MASGRLMGTTSPARVARMMSGMRRSAAQSPPPMTLPARTDATRAVPASPKNDWRKALVTSSLQPFEFEYGS